MEWSSKLLLTVDPMAPDKPLALAFLWGFLFGRQDFSKGEPTETSRITFFKVEGFDDVIPKR